jgi:HEAT repeat protein
LASGSDDRTREAAIRSLGDLGDKRATDPLLAFLNAETPAPLERTAVAALGNLRDAKAAPRLIELLYEERGDVSFYDDARFSLIQIGEPAVPLLVAAMQRKNPKIEGMKLPNGQPLPDGAIEARAGSVLGAMRAKSAEAALVSTLGELYGKYKSTHEDSLGGAIVELAYALGYLGTPEASKALHPLIEDNELAIRVAAVEALTAAGDTTAVPLLITAAKNGSDDARRAAIVAITRLGDGSQLPELATLVGKDEALAAAVQDDKARLEAAQQCKTDTKCWRGKLADANPRVRERAAYQLGWAGDQGGKDALLKSAEDSVPEVRVASVLSLERLGNIDVKSLRAIQERSGDRMEYRAVNAEIARVLASARDTQ